MAGRGSFDTTVTVANSDCGASSAITPEAMLLLMQDVATAGSDSIGLTHSALLDDFGMIFMVAAHAVKFFELIKAGETVHIHTDPAGARGVHLFRQTIFSRPDGKVIAEGQSDWILIDAKTGRPRRSTDLPIPMDNVDEWKPFCDPSRLRLSVPTDFFCDYEVSEKDIDINRHMNNTVYAGLLAKCFPEAENRPVSEFYLRYHSQAHYGDTISLKKSVSDDGLNPAAGMLGDALCFSGAIRFF